MQALLVLPHAAEEREGDHRNDVEDTDDDQLWEPEAERVVGEGLRAQQPADDQVVDVEDQAEQQRRSCRGHAELQQGTKTGSPQAPEGAAGAVGDGPPEQQAPYHATGQVAVDDGPRSVARNGERHGEGALRRGPTELSDRARAEVQALAQQRVRNLSGGAHHQGER